MITPLAKRKALAALAVTDKHGLVLSPAVDTPMAQLAESIMPISIDNIPDNREDSVALACQLADEVHDGGDTHSNLIDDMVDEYSELAIAVMNHTRTVALPTINEVYESVMDLLSQHRPLPHNIAVMRYGAVADHPVTDEMMQTSSSMTLRQHKLDISCSEFNEADLCELLATGSGGFDEALIEDISKQPKGFLENLYRKYFIEHGELPLQTTHDSPKYLLTFVIISLLAVALKEHPPENSGLTLSTYGDRLSELGSQARLRYGAIQRHRSTQRKHNVVILLRNADRDTIYHDPEAATNTVVNGDVYAEFLNNGGSPETIMGAAISGHPASRMAELLENQQALLNAYEHAENQSMAESSMKQASIAREYTTQQVIKVIGKLPEEHRNSDVSIEWLKDAAVEFIEGKSIHHFNEGVLYNTIRTTLCKTVFAHTQALTFLERMDEFEQLMGGDVSPREAGYFAMIDMLAASLLSQIEVSIEKQMA